MYVLSHDLRYVTPRITIIALHKDHVREWTKGIIFYDEHDLHSF